MKQKTLGILSVCIGLGLWAGQAAAGYRVREDVYVQASYHYAYGAMSSARDSADSTQYIGCYVQSTIAVCHAKSPAGVFAMCYTTDAANMTLLRSLNSGSELFFNWDQNGVCTSIQVSNYSYYGDKPQ